MSKNDLPYQPNNGQTHWQGCWRCVGHHNCAVEMVDKLREAIERFLYADPYNEDNNDEYTNLYNVLDATAPEEAKE